MKIVHVCQYFQESMSYQENLLPEFQARLGNEVFVITSDREYMFNNNVNSRIVGCKEVEVLNYKLIRLPIIFESVNRFVNFKNLKSILEQLKPDLIYHHGLTSPSLFTCISYKKKNNCLLKVDCHSDLKNSMSGLGGTLYHKILWKPILKKMQIYFDGIDYVAPSCLEFLRDVYELDENLYNFTVLGGDSSILKNSIEYRKIIRKEYNIEDNQIVFIHCGKLDSLKRTKELLIAFNKLNNDNIKLMIIGSINKDYEDDIKEYLNDRRIIFVGWKSADEMLKYFCSGDVLIQPGSLSAIFQNAMCCGLPVILDNTSMGSYLTENDCGILVNGESSESIKDGIVTFLKNPKYYKERCEEYAIPKLDYSEIAKKTLQIIRK